MRFFHRCRTFWQQKGGFGAIEAALMLPIFLMFTFAVIDLGNLMLKKQAAASAARTIANAIQTNPAISSADLTRVIDGALSNLAGKKGWQNDLHLSWVLGSSTTPPNLETYQGAGILGKLWRAWVANGNGVVKRRTVPPNPWLADNDPSNDNNPYYIGVFVWRDVPWLTPLPKLVGISTNFSNGQSSIDPILAPYGRKQGISAYELVTLNNMTCPSDQVLQSVTNGVSTCVPRDNNYQCSSGQVLEKIVDGQAICISKDNTCNDATQVLRGINPDGTAICVARDATYACNSGEVLQVANNGTKTCVAIDRNYACSGNQVLQSTSNGSAVCVDKGTTITTQTCALGQVMTGINSSGGIQCAAPPAPATPAIPAGFSPFKHIVNYIVPVQTTNTDEQGEATADFCSLSYVDAYSDYPSSGEGGDNVKCSVNRSGFDIGQGLPKWRLVQDYSYGKNRCSFTCFTLKSPDDRTGDQPYMACRFLDKAKDILPRTGPVQFTGSSGCSP